MQLNWHAGVKKSGKLCYLFRHCAALSLSIHSFCCAGEKNLLSVHFLQNVMKAMNCSSFGIKMSAIAIKPTHT